jgi:hypothetical protein
MSTTKLHERIYAPYGRLAMTATWHSRRLVADGRRGATGMGGSSVDYRDRSDSGEERVTQQMAPTLY